MANHRTIALLEDSARQIRGWVEGLEFSGVWRRVMLRRARLLEAEAEALSGREEIRHE